MVKKSRYAYYSYLPTFLPKNPIRETRIRIENSLESVNVRNIRAFFSSRWILQTIERKNTFLIKLFSVLFVSIWSQQLIFLHFLLQMITWKIFYKFLAFFLFNYWHSYIAIQRNLLKPTKIFASPSPPPPSPPHASDHLPFKWENYISILLFNWNKVQWFTWEECCGKSPFVQFRSRAFFFVRVKYRKFLGLFRSCCTISMLKFPPALVPVLLLNYPYGNFLSWSWWYLRAREDVISKSLSFVFLEWRNSANYTRRSDIPGNKEFVQKFWSD